MYIDPHDVESMVAALGQVLSDGQLRRHLSERTKAQAVRASWSDLARETLRLYGIAARTNGPLMNALQRRGARES
jgi:glycosyltransferase involved in cell wall biosynthesis